MITSGSSAFTECHQIITKRTLAIRSLLNLRSSAGQAGPVSMEWRRSLARDRDPARRARDAARRRSN
jgi:hypothetical protein